MPQGLGIKTVKEIYEGEAYNKLREAHTNETFDDISYCKDCDFLYDDNDVLVYSNIENFKLRQMMTTSLYL